MLTVGEGHQQCLSDSALLGKTTSIAGIIAGRKSW